MSEWDVLPEELIGLEDLSEEKEQDESEEKKTIKMIKTAPRPLT